MIIYFFQGALYKLTIFFLTRKKQKAMNSIIIKWKKFLEYNKKNYEKIFRNKIYFIKKYLFFIFKKYKSIIKKIDLKKYFILLRIITQQIILVIKSEYFKENNYFETYLIHLFFLIKVHL